MRKLLAAILCAVMLLAVAPAGLAAEESAAADPDQMELAYEVDFNGTKDIFEPKGIFGNFDQFTYAVSDGGKTLNVVGNDFAGSSNDGTTGQTHWGGIVRGLTAGATSKYTVTYKVKNNSAKNYSQVGIGGWSTDDTLMKYWNVSSTYNAPGTVQLGMMMGNSNSVGGSNANKAMLQKDADRDADGFLDIKVEYDGVYGTMTLFTKKDGEWVELYTRDIDVAAGNRFGVFIYTFRTGAINMTIKDMKIYANNGKKASTVETFDDAAENLVTGYAQVPIEFTLAEAKARYGIDKLLSAAGLSAEAVFRNRMDAFWARIPYTVGTAVKFAEDFPDPTRNFKEYYVTFSCAVDPKTDTALQNRADGIKLQYTADGTTWQDAPVTFTAQPTGDALSLAKDVPDVGVSAEHNAGKDFESARTIPSYRFVSTKFTAAKVKNIRLLPCGDGAGQGDFRLLDLFVWGVTDQMISVPLLDGNQNPEAKESKTKSGATEYELYRTDFANTDSWTTNVISYRQSGKETVNGKSRRYTYFTLSGNLPTTDGQSVRLYSPNMELDARQYQSVTIDFSFFRIKGESDPELKNFRVGYSTDNGATWVKIATKPKLTAVTSGAVDGEGRETYRITMDLKRALPNNETVTNIVLLPYDEDSWYNVVYSGTNIDGVKRVTGPMIGSKGAFRMLDFSLKCVASGSGAVGSPIDDDPDAAIALAKNAASAADPSELTVKAVPVYKKNYDSIVLQTLLDEAAKAGKKEVMIPAVNPRDGSNVWVIGETVRIPSDMTVYVDNCTLRFENFCLCHMLENKNAGSQYASMEDHDIHVVGLGNALLSGGVYNGISSSLISGTGVSTWSNMLFLLQNVNRFSISNLRIEESRFWSIVLYYCSNGSVQHMDYCNSRSIQAFNGVELREQDGIDIRNGCENILINDVTGRTGDDSVAINCIRPASYEVHDKSGNVKNIVITNVFTKLVRMCMNVRITATNGWKVNDVLVDNVRDMTADFGGRYGTAVVMIGDASPGYATSAPMGTGDINGVYLRNITGCTPYPIAVRHRGVLQKNWAYEYDSCTNLYAGTAESALVSEGETTGSLSSPMVIEPVNCEHVWTRKLTGTAHLQGLPAEAANFEWYGCENCNAVKRPDGVTALLAASGESSAVSASVFTDVAADSPFKTAIDWAVAQGITYGKTPTTFEPNTICTTGNIIAFIWRANGCPEPTIANPFRDIQEGQYYYKAAIWAQEKGMVAGEKFNANAPCTRAQTVTYLWKQAGSPAEVATDRFTDVAEDEDYAQAVAWALKKGVTTGVTPSLFRPDDTCTRGQIVTFLFRAR
ncbi:MAG: S-layer homology domain-containing protein [Oscillibacter sp.]|nr:S-layer homology domain-containing protein [Oscillibacter sp.]